MEDTITAAAVAATRTGSSGSSGLQSYREHLEGELKNVQELIERLGEAPQPTQTP